MLFIHILLFLGDSRFKRRIYFTRNGQANDKARTDKVTRISYTINKPTNLVFVTESNSNQEARRKDGGGPFLLSSKLERLGYIHRSILKHSFNLNKCYGCFRIERDIFGAIVLLPVSRETNSLTRLSMKSPPVIGDHIGS